MKMKNVRKTADWIEMALEDLDAAVADIADERYPASVFHAQQCTEKLMKAVLYFFGIIHEKTALFKNPVIAKHFTIVSHHFHHIGAGKTIPCGFHTRFLPQSAH
ncbi:MAG: hypothetical protein C4B59_09895, partial [Candidatus Methanogaster sp.]